MIVLDTTVLVYAVGSDHPLHEPAQAVIGAIASGRVRATTTVEVIQEFTHVRARRRSRADAASIGRDFVDLLSPLVELDASDAERGLAFFEQSASLGAFDAFLAATVVDREHLTTLVSADRGFGDVDRLDFCSLADKAGIATLIG